MNATNHSKLINLGLKIYMIDRLDPIDGDRHINLPRLVEIPEPIPIHYVDFFRNSPASR